MPAPERAKKGHGENRGFFCFKSGQIETLPAVQLLFFSYSNPIIINAPQ